jgi:hypothetical protein
MESSGPDINPVSQFVTVTVVLFALALIPLFVHPTFRKTGEHTAGYLVAMAVTAGGITMLGMSPAKGWAAPLLLLYAALVVTWTVTATIARRRTRAVRRRARQHAERIAFYDRQTGTDA